GGYYLYYNVISANTGLPDTIFNDKGEATISLLITYRKPDNAANENLLAGYMNSVVTGDSIDLSRSVLFAQSESQQLAITAQSSDSLQQIADRYYLKVGNLAALNANQALAPQTKLKISNPIYQVGPNAPGANLNDIAAYFQVSVDSIKSLNS